MDIYSSRRWKSARAAAIRRDGRSCTVARLLGGDCSRGPLHVHHVVPLEDDGAPFDLDNLGTTCARHHPTWEALRRTLVRRRQAPPPRCRHQHRSVEARLICEARLARQAARADLANVA